MRRLLAGLAAGLAVLSLTVLGAAAASPAPSASAVTAYGCPNGTMSVPWQTGCVPGG
jgi:hypothetical protein